MNATNDASKTALQKAIDVMEKQNDYMFATRKRLFAVERTQKHTALILIVFGLILVLDQLKGIISW